MGGISASCVTLTSETLVSDNIIHQIKISDQKFTQMLQPLVVD